MGITDHTRYLAWNSRIALFWLTRPNEAGRVYLTVTPASLAAAAWECDGTPLAPAEAEQDFVSAVTEMYRTHVVSRGYDLETLAEMHDGIPLSIAFLAASVFAAYRMREDHLRRSTAYFPRLAELLGYTAELDEPPSFDRASFERLWMRAAQWTQDRLVVGGDVLRHYEAHPIANAALRQVDLDRLPDFFEWASYAPGASIALDRLRADFLSWLGSGSTLTPRGRDACFGDHQAAAVQQIAVELKAWDGVAPDPSGRRVSTVEVALDFLRGIPKLFLLARRPLGFPDAFEHEEHRFDSLSEGWYEPLPLPQDGGGLLLDGFEWISRQQEPHCVLRRNGSRVIALAVSEDTAGLVSRRRLLAGVECALLVHESAVEAARARIERLGGSGARWVDDPELPQGWRLVDRIRIARPDADAFPGMEALEVDAAVELVARGGLRASRRAEWLTEAPPKIYVSGLAPDVAIDDQPARVEEDGRIVWARSRMTAGEHRIGAGRYYKRISLVDAQLSPSLVDLVNSSAHASVPMGLARRRWDILGERSAEIFQVSLRRQEVVQVPFEPVWAVSGSCALYVIDRESRPTASAVGESRRWANVVLGAAQRAVEVAVIDPRMTQQAIHAWRQYQATASRIMGSGDTGEPRGRP